MTLCRLLWRRGLTASLLGALCLLPAFSSTAQDDKRVALTFDWPSGLGASVTFDHRRTVNGETDYRNLSGSYDLTTSTVDDGLLLRFENGEMSMSGKVFEKAESSLQARLVRYATSAMREAPGFVVGPDGDFLRAAGLDAFRSAILGGIDDAFPDLPADLRDQLRQILAPLFSREGIETKLAADWASSVGAWAGASMDEGELYEGTSYLRSGLFGEAPTPVRAVSVFKKRVPCSASEAARRCIELESRLFPNRDLLAKAMDAIMAMIQGQVPAGTTLPRIEGFEIEMVERLITEPGTLLPHLMETTMHISFMMMAGDVPGQTGSIIDQKRSVYTH